MIIPVTLNGGIVWRSCFFLLLELFIELGAFDEVVLVSAEVSGTTSVLGFTLSVALVLALESLDAALELAWPKTRRRSPESLRRG